MADRDEILNQIRVLQPGQFSVLVFHCGKRQQDIFADGMTLLQKSVALIEVIEDEDATLEKLQAALKKTLDPAPLPEVSKPSQSVEQPPTATDSVSRQPPARRTAKPRKPRTPAAMAETESASVQAKTAILPPVPTPLTTATVSSSPIHILPSTINILPPPPISRAALRQLIDKVLPNSAGLDAFLFDMGDEVWSRIQGDHDRATRVNLLFACFETDMILRYLRSREPEAVTRSLERIQAALGAGPMEAEPSEYVELPGRFELRKLLSQLFPLDSEFNAFCLDYFPEILAVQSPSKDIDRNYKYDLLINSTRWPRLLACLRQRYPERLRQVEQTEIRPTPTLSSLRSLLRAVLPKGGELVQFFMEHYPEAYRGLSHEFDRVRAENRLLLCSHPADILYNLAVAEPQRVAHCEHILEFDELPAAQDAASALSDLLNRSLALDSEVDAFCMDHFPGVYCSFTDGTNKDEKLKRLLVAERYDAIKRALRRHLQDVPPNSLPPPSASQIKARRGDGVVISQRMLRQILYRMFATDEQFMQFCSAYFPQAIGLTMSGMDRVQKTTILLQKTDQSALVARLRELDDRAFERLSTEQVHHAQDFIAKLTNVENQNIPPRPQLRWMLNQTLRVDSDLRSFCSDLFPSVQPFISVGMERNSIITLLLERIPGVTLYGALQHQFPGLKNPQPS